MNNLLEGNKYFKWYWSICDRAKDRVLTPDIYVERHHIYPKSIYGQNKDLVKLTAKEHYIVHLLLWWGLRTKYGTKDQNTRKMAGAFNCMNMKKKGTYQRYNSRLYEFLRIAYCESFDVKRIHSYKITKKVYGYSINDEKLYYIFHSTKEASENTNIPYIKRCCNSTLKSSGGFIWSYKELTNEELNDRIINIKFCKNKSKIVYQYNDKMLINSYRSVLYASFMTGISRGAINGCCNNRLYIIKKYIFSYNILSSEELQERINIINDYNINSKINRSNCQIGKKRSDLYLKKVSKPVVQYTLDDIFVKEYKSQRFASRETGIHQSSIRNCCLGKRKNVGNFKWKLKNE